MITVYVYVLDTLADWEIGFVTAELNSRRFFKKDAPPIAVKTVSDTKVPIHTMGGLTVIPDGVLEDIVVSKDNLLLLPGANTWGDPSRRGILEKAEAFLSVGAGVCAICGATVALADAGLLNHRPHTSNGPGFLEMVSAAYRGKAHYVDQPSMADDNLITAASTGGLLWAKQILDYLEVFQPDTLKAWYDYFSTGNPEAFFALMQSLPAEK